MKGDVREKISALCDDELQAEEAEALLNQLLDERSLHKEWERYHMISDLMHGEVGLVDASGIADRVRDSLRDEPPIARAPIPFRRPRKPFQRPANWGMPALGAALAASVTAVAMTYLPAMQGERDISPAAGVQQVALAETSPGPDGGHGVAPKEVSLSGADWKTLDRNSELGSKLNDYIVGHREFASPMGVAPVGPYALNVRHDGGR